MSYTVRVTSENTGSDTTFTTIDEAEAFALTQRTPGNTVEILPSADIMPVFAGGPVGGEP